MVEYTLSRGRQSLNGEAIDMAHAPRLRARIKRDSYDSQSYGIAEAWTETSGWKDISHQPIEAFKVAALSPYGPDNDAWKPILQEDLDGLLALGRDFFAGKA